MAHLIQRLKEQFALNSSDFSAGNNFVFGGASLSTSGGGYGFGPLLDNAEQLIAHARSQGVWAFDTAPIYGFGESELKLGYLLKNERHKVCLISKGGVSWHANKRVNMSNDPRIIETMLCDSLQRLQTDYIDIYMIHWPDPSVDIRRPMEILLKAKDQGKIKHIGLCNTNWDEINKASEIAAIEIVQSEFNLWANTEQKKFVKSLAEKNISFISWGTLDKGILAQTVTAKRKFDASDCRSWAPWWKGQKKEQKYLLVEKIKQNLGHELAPEDPPMALLYLAFAFNFSCGVDMALSGPKSIAQLDRCLNAVKWAKENSAIAVSLSKLESLLANHS